MNKYYLRSIREDGFGECVLPKWDKPKRNKFSQSPSEQQYWDDELRDQIKDWELHLASLPVSALAHPDLAKKIGWVENYEVHYQVYDHWTNNEWKCVSKITYEAVDGANRRILLVENKQEEKSEIKPKPADAQCTDCTVDEPYENEIMAGGVLCLGCGRRRPATKYILPPVSGEPGGLQDENYVEGLKWLLRHFCDCPEIVIENPYMLKGDSKPLSKETLEWAHGAIERYEKDIAKEQDELWDEIDDAIRLAFGIDKYRTGQLTKYLCSKYNISRKQSGEQA